MQTLQTFSAQAMIDILKNIGNWIFVLAMFIMVVMIIIGAAILLTGGGDPNRIATGRKTLMWAVVGLVVALLAQGIFTVVRSIIGA